MKKSSNSKSKEIIKEKEVSISEIKEILSKSPTKSKWKKELERILNGKRDGYLNYLGNIRIYIEKELFPALSADRSNLSKTESIFKKALRNVVEEWNPTIEREKEYFACMLELVQFDPSITQGFEKVYKFLEIWEHRIKEIKSFGGYNSQASLVKESLISLGKNFSTPPDAESGNFERYKNYIGVLKRYLFNPSLSGYSAVRLIQLNMYNLEDIIFRKAIKQNPQTLEELCSLIFSSDEKYKLNENLATLCIHSFSIGGKVVELFQQFLNLYDVTLETAQNNITVFLSNDKLFTMDLTKFNVHFVPVMNDADLLGGVNRIKNSKEFKKFEEFYKSESPKWMSVTPSSLRKLAVKGKEKAVSNKQ